VYAWVDQPVSGLINQYLALLFACLNFHFNRLHGTGSNDPLLMNNLFSFCLPPRGQSQSEDTHDDLSKAEAHSGAAEAFVIMEDFEGALHHYNLYIKLLTDFEPARHDLLNGIALVNQATVLLQVGRYEEATESVKKAIGMEDESKYVGRSKGGLGIARPLAHRLASELQRVLAHVSSLCCLLNPSLDSWQHAYQQGLLGISLRNMGDLEGAYKAFHGAEMFYEQVIKEEEEAILDRACNLRSLSLVSHVGLLFRSSSLSGRSYVWVLAQSATSRPRLTCRATLQSGCHLGVSPSAETRRGALVEKIPA
jgi:tetratricopeptide (TPR) repeat protein